MLWQGLIKKSGNTAFCCSEHDSLTNQGAILVPDKIRWIGAILQQAKREFLCVELNLSLIFRWQYLLLLQGIKNF